MRKTTRATLRLRWTSDFFLSLGIKILATSIVIVSPGIALALPTRDGPTANEPSKQAVEQRVMTQPARILLQMKGSVCGTGPFYAGKVDDPIFVTPLHNPNCTISMTPPSPR